MSPPNPYRAQGSVVSGAGSKAVGGSWDEYRLHVVQSLARIDDTLEKLWQAFSDVKRDVTSLKIKVAVWSAAFGFAGAAVPIVLDAILRWREIAAR
jgi:hypothetical protein